MRLTAPARSGGRRPRRVGPAQHALAAIGVVSLVLATGACGGGSSHHGVASKSPTQILHTAETATKAATSVRVAGSVSLNGGRVTLDIVATHHGGGGSVSEGGATIHTIVTGTTVYLMADRASWQALTHSAAAARELAGRWVESPAANSSFGSLTKLFDLTDLISSLRSTGTLTKGKVTTFGGRRVVPVTASKGGTLYVDATGTPYIRAIEKSGTGEVRFEQYNTAKAPPAPRRATPLSHISG